MNDDGRYEPQEPDSGPPPAAQEQTEKVEDLLKGNLDTEDVPDGEKTDQPIVVGLGASAGGLEALSAFFDVMPPDTGLTFAVVTHLSPDHESILDELLQRHTRMPVIQVRDEQLPIAPNHVYVIPPNRQLVLTDHHLYTGEFDGARAARAPIDIFFRSLAAVHAEPIAIVLSGGGSDGALGIRSVKEASGVVLVQAPEEAAHDSMPLAAIATGVADFVLPVRDLARKLVEINHHRVHVPSDVKFLSPEQQDALHRILVQLQARTGLDFRAYKQTTVLRRIQRRLQLSGHETLDGYLAFMRQSADEIQLLLRDLLIGVTNFFRDDDSWQYMADNVIPELFQGRGRDDAIRVWSLGCSTGEEAYSLAILLLEHAATLERPPQLQIFATDLDDRSLVKAREGLYPDTIATDVSPERLGLYFTREGAYYRVRREVRDIVLFATHSVLRDPPFSRLDLITCRNLLIYLQRPLQDNVFEIFRYALRSGGFLFLGSSESADNAADLFQTVDKKHRVYTTREWVNRQPGLPALPLAGYTPRQQPRARRVEQQPQPFDTLYQTSYEQTLEEFGPATILVDRYANILRLSGTAGRYLRHPDGAPTQNLNRLIHPDLQFELRGALIRAFEKGLSTVTPLQRVAIDGDERRVVLAVRPRVVPGEPSLALVMVLEDQSRSDVEADSNDEPRPDASVLKQLEAEIHYLRERLQTSAEEYESSNEELKAANEELQSINEEYRSTTEELETSKEELQSVNEELETVNTELKISLEEVSRAHNDLQNLMAATEIATLFLDRELRIKRYTAGVEELFNIMSGDRGRPLTHLTHQLDYPELTDDVRHVLQTLMPLEREVRRTGDGWLLARLRPYRTVDDRIEGIVITFVDITRLKEAEQSLYESRQLVDLALHAAGMGWGMWNLSTGRTEGDARTRAILGLAGDDDPTIDQWLAHIHPDDRSRLESAIRDRTEADERLDVAFRVILPDDQMYYLRATGAMLAGPGDELRLTSILRDETEGHHHERELREARANLQQALWSADIGWGSFDLETGALEQDARARAIVGLPAEGPLMLDQYLAIIHPDDMTRVLNDLQARLSDGKTPPLEYRIVRPDGEVRHIRGTGLVRYNDAGQPFQITGTLEDITDRRRNEEALRALTESLESRVRERTRELEDANLQLIAAHERIRAIFAANPMPSLIYNLDEGVYTDANPAFLAYTGLAREQVIGHRPEAFAAFGDPREAELGEIVARDGRVRDFVTSFALRPDERRTVLVAVEPVTLDGQASQVITMTDITRFKEAEGKIRQQQRDLEAANADLTAARDRFQMLFHANPIPSTLIELEDLVYLDANQAYLQFYGLERDQVIGQSIINPVHWPDAAARQAVFDQYRQRGRLHNEEMAIKVPTGEQRVVLASDTPFTLDGRRCMLATFIDITDRKQAEEQVRQLASQLTLAEQEERQRIASILHDDLQQRLYALQVQVAALGSRLAGGDLASIPGEIDTVHNALAQTGEVARRLSVELAPPILHDENLYHALIWLASQMKEQFELDVTVELTTDWRRVDDGLRTGLFQVVRELLFNVAKHAGVGVATVTLAQYDDILEIRVRDGGAGFDAEQTLNDPLFQGHGLSMARRRIELFGGRLEIDAAPDRGTMAAVIIPIATWYV